MNNLLFILTGFLILAPIIAYSINKKYFYYSLLVTYPIIGQTISAEVTVFGLTLNPSMIFGVLVLLLTVLDFLLFPSADRLLEILVILFIIYTFFSCAFSPRRLESLSWAMKIATWLLLLISSRKVFGGEKDLVHIHTASCVAVLIVLFSFMWSSLGYYGDSFTYETGVKTYGAGFSSGKTLSYYLAFVIPVLASRLNQAIRIVSGISVVLILSSLIVIFLNFVRAPVVALLIGYLSYQYYGIKYAGKRLGGVTITILLLAVLITGVAIYLGDTQYMSRWGELGNKYFEGRIEKLGSGRVGIFMSFIEFYFYKATWAQRILGTGLGASVVYLGHDLIIHNDFAEILMGCGIIGFTLYVFIQIRIYTTLLAMLKNKHRPENLRCGTLAIACFFIFLSFHMTNLTSGVLMLSLWSIYTGAVLAYGTKMTHKTAVAG